MVSFDVIHVVKEERQLERPGARLELVKLDGSGLRAVAQDRHQLRWQADGAALHSKLLTYGLTAAVARSAASLQMAAAQRASV